MSDTEPSFLDLHLSILEGFVWTKIYDKRDEFDFDNVNFPFLDGDVSRSTSYGVYISQLIRFVRVSSHVYDFNTRNKVLTAKLHRQGYKYRKIRKSRKEKPQKLTQLSSRSHPRQLVGKRTAQKDITIDTTSDSQVNSNFPNRWSPASLTFNNYFYLFLYLYITRITTNNNAPHLKSPKNQSRRAALGRPAIKITGGLQLVFGRPTLALSSALVSQTPSCLVCVEDS